MKVIWVECGHHFLVESLISAVLRHFWVRLVSIPQYPCYKFQVTPEPSDLGVVFAWLLTSVGITPHLCTGSVHLRDMETVVRRCPFLSRVPQAFLQKAGKSLLFYAQNCPKMMEVGAKPAPRALSASAVLCQQVKETPPANESKCP